MKVNNFSKQGLLLVVLLLGALQPAVTLAAQSSEELITSPVAPQPAVSQVSPTAGNFKLPKMPKPCCNDEECAMINGALNAAAIQTFSAAHAMRAQKADVVAKYKKNTRKFLIRGGVLAGVGILGSAILGAGVYVALPSIIPCVFAMMADSKPSKDDLSTLKKGALIAAPGLLLALSSATGQFWTCGLLPGLVRTCRKPFSVTFASGCHKAQAQGRRGSKQQKRCQAVLKVAKPDFYTSQQIDCTATLGGYSSMIIEWDPVKGAPKARLVA